MGDYSTWAITDSPYNPTPIYMETSTQKHSGQHVNQSVTRDTDHNWTTPGYGNDALWEVNEEIARTLIPSMVYIAVLMVCGVLGNILVCYVFSKKLRHSTQNYLFVVLAIFDLMSCCIAMPTEILDMRYYFAFPSEVACKVLRFLVAFPILASNSVLLIIAVDRFRKVCRPLYDQVTRKLARMSVTIAVFTAIIGSIPAIFIYGRRSAQTRIPGLVGNDCSTSDAMEGKIYPLVYEISLGVVFLTYTISLLTLYLLIWREIRRHKAYMKKNANYAVLLMSRERSGDSDPPSTPRSRSLSQNDVTSPNSRGSTQPLPLARAQRTTVIAFLVTFVFILSFVPHLCLIMARSIKKDFDHNLSPVNLVLYNIFIRSYFVNSVANPIIYGVMNYRFRRECVRTFRRVCCCS